MPRNSRYRVPDLPPDSPAVNVVGERASRKDWLAARTQGIGGSEIGALVGANPHMTPFDVFRNKVSPPAEITGNVHIQVGHDYEETVAKIAARKLGLVKRSGGGLWRHSDHEFALVTPDFIFTKPRSWDAHSLVECKTAASAEGWDDGFAKDGFTNVAPLQYRAQTNWQLGILGLEVGWIACQVFDESKSFYIYKQVFDPEWFSEMIQVSESFWHTNVLAWEPPMHDLEHPRTTELLKELYPKAISPATEIDDDGLDWILEMIAAKEALKKAQARVDEAQNAVRLIMRDAARAYYGDHQVVSYPEVRSGGVDTSILKERYPEIAEECAATGTHRRMTVKIPPKLKKELEDRG